MKQRQDVSAKIKERSDYRGYRRYHKRYRPKRFNNRSASKRKGRIPPSIKQKKQAILRVVKRLNKYIRIDKIILEDVAIDIRKLTEGKVLYNWQYQNSNWLDENLRKATLKRDDYTCQLCGVTDTMLHAHHIIPRQDNGADSIYNLITLCKDCHKNKVDGNEYQYKEQFLSIINGKEIDLKPAMHVMQGKTWLRDKLLTIAKLKITIGGDTANRRIDYDIKKSHSNDAVCITNLLPVDKINIKEYFIKPLRKKKANKIKLLEGFKHRDIIRYTKRNGETYTGYITSLRVKNNKYNSKVCNFTTLNGEKTFRGYGLTNLTLINRPQGLMII
jgi:5-methylcytosine-specific restriction endonuclease McrA